MNEERFNIDTRRFLKHFGVTAQREIEKAVAAGIADGRLKGTERLKARACSSSKASGSSSRSTARFNSADADLPGGPAALPRR